MRRLIVILVVFVAALSFSALAQDLTSPPTGKALIYVYRPTTTWGPKWPVHVFVNGDLLGALPSSGYALSEVAPGAVVLSAPDCADFFIKGLWAFSFNFRTTQDQSAPFSYLSSQSGWHSPPSLQWPKCEGTKRTYTWDTVVQSAEKEDCGCGKVDWNRVGEASKKDVGVCENALYETLAALANWFGTPPSKPGGVLIILPTRPGANGGGGGVGGWMVGPSSGSGPTGDSVWLQMCGPNPLPKPSSPEADKIRRDVTSGNYSNDWSRCQRKAAEAFAMLRSKERLRIEVEAGKTYYVRWAGKKMELVDAAKGTKEISGLQPFQLAKD